MIVQTHNGELYELDTWDQTWCRIIGINQAGTIRTKIQKYELICPLRAGHPMTVFLEAREPGGNFPVVVTGPVSQIFYPVLREHKGDS